MISRSLSAAASLDWNDVRFFLAVARQGSMAKAARALAVDQTTVGRRVASLEQKLRVGLFARTATGLRLTAAGERVLEAAERMREAALDLSSQAAHDGGVGGTVRVATTDSLAHTFVVPALRALQERDANIQVVLVSGWPRADLRGGEADVAVRLVRPTDPRLAGRKLGEFAMRLYASPSYVERYGAPTSLRGHAIVAYDETVRAGAGPLFCDIDTDGSRIALQANSGYVLVDAVRAGLGIAELPGYVGDGDASLVRVLSAYEYRYAVWLVVPQARRRLAAVRAVCDAIVRAFSAAAPPTPAPARADRSPRTSRRRS